MGCTPLAAGLHLGSSYAVLFGCARLQGCISGGTDGCGPPLHTHLFTPYFRFFHVYKVCHLSFVSVNSTDEGPGLDRNVWNLF